MDFTRREILDALSKITGWAALKGAGVGAVESALSKASVDQRSAAIKAVFGKWSARLAAVSGPSGSIFNIAGIEFPVTSLNSQQAMLMISCADPNSGAKVAIDVLKSLKPTADELMAASRESFSTISIEIDASETTSYDTIKAITSSERNLDDKVAAIKEHLSSIGKNDVAITVEISPDHPVTRLTGSNSADDIAKWCEGQSDNFANGFGNQLKEAKKQTRKLFQKAADDAAKTINS
jgi:hypothetical protein